MFREPRCPRRCFHQRSGRTRETWKQEVGRWMPECLMLRDLEMRLPAMSSHMIRKDQAMEVWAGSRFRSVRRPTEDVQMLERIRKRWNSETFVSSSLTQHRGGEPADTQEPARVDPSQPSPHPLPPPFSGKAAGCFPCVYQAGSEVD